MPKTVRFLAFWIVLFYLLSALPVAGAERFIDNGDGTVTDRQTQLMWAKEDNFGDISWRDAVIYCKHPPIAGYKYSNWRLPTVKELATLYDKQLKGYETDCGLDVRIPRRIRLSCAWIWAADHKAISACAFNFNKGYPYSTLMLEKKNFRVLPVRNLQ